MGEVINARCWNGIVKKKLKDRISFLAPTRETSSERIKLCVMMRNIFTNYRHEEFSRAWKTSLATRSMRSVQKVCSTRVFTYHKLLSVTFAYHTSIWIMNWKAGGRVLFVYTNHQPEKWEHQWDWIASRECVEWLEGFVSLPLSLTSVDVLTRFHYDERFFIL